MQSPRVIGLTGAVGAGKSTVRSWLADHGAATIDADRVVHHLMASDPAVIDSVQRRFGPGVMTDGVVDRAALGSIVFADRRALRDLESIVHPAVTKHVEAWLDNIDRRVAAVEAIKLLESDLADRCDVIWLVACPRRVRTERIMDRGWSRAEVERRIAAGPPLAPMLARSDVVIDNGGTKRATKIQLHLAWRSAVCRCGGPMGDAGTQIANDSESSSGTASGDQRP